MQIVKVSSYFSMYKFVALNEFKSTIDSNTKYTSS